VFKFNAQYVLDAIRTSILGQNLNLVIPVSFAFYKLEEGPKKKIPDRLKRLGLLWPRPC